MTSPDEPYAKKQREALVAQLEHSGVLRDPRWRDAFREVPRHTFVPEFYEQHGGVWTVVTPSSSRYLPTVYGDSALTTQVADGWPTSSSSQPSLMVRMLEALDVRDGQTVGEVATGTGYNCALLCHRVGASNVVSVEVDRGLVCSARERLAQIGFRPELTVGDARLGFATERSLDRLIVTCGLDTFPHALAGQVRPGGIVLAPVGLGNAKLRVGEDGLLQGSFLAAGSSFMRARRSHETGAVPYPGEPGVLTTGRPNLGLDALQDEGFGFVRSLLMPGTGESRELTPEGEQSGLRLWTADGSWAHVDPVRVQQGSGRQLWDEIEELHRWYVREDRPTRERFGLAVSPDEHRVWLDRPDRPVPRPR